ncbi:pyridoxamine 5'-phosphate oxidase family protein [Dactylosporangium sp. CA-092794]|uniref:pyridoxamine 5'-phosphate oxidase family protein n=1 Tax=Dactylosporangium sp. CA-092794 TaxID=3239929 RepID=UPI003D8D4CE6
MTVLGPSTAEVWRALEKASFAVIGYVTPDGQPRSSGVVYAVAGRRLYVAVAENSWKARHIELAGRVSVTVPVTRGGPLSLLFPIPPATVSFHGPATVSRPGALAGSPAAEALGRLLPPERRADGRIVEISPEGWFVTYGIGVPLQRMRVPALARGRVPVG